MNTEEKFIKLISSIETKVRLLKIDMDIINDPLTDQNSKCFLLKSVIKDLNRLIDKLNWLD